MPVQYRSDIGTVVASAVSTNVLADFIAAAQPQPGDLIVAGGSFFEPTSNYSVTVTDNRSNTYNTALVLARDGDTTFPVTNNVGSAAMFYAENIAAPGRIVLTFDVTAGTGNYFVCGAVAFSGVVSSGALDVTSSLRTSGAVNSAGSGTTGAVALADCVAVSFWSYGLGSTNLLSVTASDYTVPCNQPSSILGSRQGGMGYKIITSLGTQSVTWNFGATTSAGSEMMVLLGVFKGGVGLGGNQSKGRRFDIRRFNTPLDSFSMLDVRAW